MKIRLYYSEKQLLEIEDIETGDSEIPKHISDSVFVMIAERETGIKALTAMGVDCSKFLQSKEPINLIETDISSHPFRPEIKRKVIYSGVFEFPTLNLFDIHYCVKHYNEEGVYIPEVLRDEIIIVHATTDIPYADTGMSRYEYFVAVVKGIPEYGISPTPIYEAATKQIVVLDYWGDFNTYVEGWIPIEVNEETKANVPVI